MLDRPAVLCPCCNRPMDGPAPVHELQAIHMPGHQRVIITALARAYPREVTGDALVTALYDHRTDGGPENARQNLAVYLCRIRKVLPRYGWTIPRITSGRGNTGRYRLEPVRKP